MNKINLRKLVSLNVSVALIAFLIWMVTSGVDVITVYGATRQIPYTYDIGSFNITDLSIKESGYSSNDLIGFIQNVDPSLRTIKGVSLKIEMYDRNNHLIDVADSGYSSSLPSEFRPQEKSAFKIPIDKSNDLDHLNIRILATDWGTSNTYPNQNIPTVGNNSSDRPYIGLAGLNLTPDISKHIGSNRTKGILIASITKDSPADKSGLRAGSTTITYNGTNMNVGGDIILKIDNQSVSKMQDIIAYVNQKHAGDKVHLTILRDNSTRELGLILGKSPSQPMSQNGDNKTNEEYYNECLNRAGKSLCDFLFKK